MIQHVDVKSEADYGYIDWTMPSSAYRSDAHELTCEPDDMPNVSTIALPFTGIAQLSIKYAVDSLVQVCGAVKDHKADQRDL
jgi:hypothetical protein